MCHVAPLHGPLQINPATHAAAQARRQTDSSIDSEISQIFGGSAEKKVLVLYLFV